MKKTAFCLALVSGAFFIFSPAVSVRAFADSSVAKGVTVDGVAVGGLSKKKACLLLRRTIIENFPTLTVETPKGRYSFTYPEIGFSDNFEQLIDGAKRGGNYTATVKYRMNGLEEQAEYICANNALTPLDAEARFSASGFTYEGERTGIICDKEELKREIESALASPVSESDGKRLFPCVGLCTYEKRADKTLSEVKKGTKKLAEFTTYFNAEDRGRSENIALAAARIDGKTVFPYEEFSFNANVGKRTKENGFHEAKIIQDGQFVSGYGGGVCQASTTLYNAALLAGLEITARRAHSLAVHYVRPSCDAMVSSFCDFRFKNPYGYPVYLSAKVAGGQITVTFYGRDEGYRYEIISVKTGEIPPPAPLEEASETDCVIREGKPGITSEAYLEKYLGGKLIERRKLHSDVYGAIRGVVGKASLSND